MGRRIPLDAFDVLEPLGRGGMGLVLGGRHRSLGIPVAIKVLLHQRAREQRAVAGFAREVRAMASLDHPAIVRVLDHGVVPDQAARADPEHLVAGSPYLVMELAHGTLEQPPPAKTWARTRSVLLTLLDALAHAHARGIVHRDLKPANVLRVRQGMGPSALKLSDFGLAYVLAHEPHDERGAAAGTPQMMAPEQFRGAIRDFGPWTDLYALGCIAYKLATGRPPFDHVDEDELARLHLREPPPPLVPEMPLPDGFAPWVLRLLQKEPERRFQRAADAARALLALGQDPRRPAAFGADAFTSCTSAETMDEATLPCSGSHPRTSSPTAPTEDGERTLEDLPALAALAATQTRDVAVPLPIALDAPRARTDVPDWRRPTTPSEPLWAAAALRLWGLRPPPFVARERERDLCWRALGDVHRFGRARAVVLRGASGFGKSRLAEWLCERAHEVGAATPLVAFHEPLARPEAGLLRMLSAHLRIGGLPRQDALDRLRRTLGNEQPATCEAIADVLAGPADDARVRASHPEALLALLERALSGLGRERPLVVWLDDAQWSSVAIALAHRMLDAQDLAPAPILFVLTVQDESLAERPFEWAQLASLAGRDDAVEIEIGPLAAEAHRELVERLLGTGGELARRVTERTAGHPLFAIQLVGDWIERGILAPSAAGLRLREGASVDLPDDLHEVWRLRIEHLLAEDHQARGAIEILALAGRRVDAAFLAAACDAAGLAYPVRLVERLLQQRLLVLLDEREGGDGITLEWAHGLLREALERAARDEGRAPAHHAAIAAALARRWKVGEPGAAARLSRHLELAGRPAEALAPLRAAAREHQERAEYDHAESLLDRHAALLDALGLPETHPERLEALIERAEVLRRRGRLDAAGALAARVGDLARGAGEHAILARASYVLGFAEVERGEVARGIERLQQAREIFERLGDLAEASRVLRAVGFACCRKRDLAAAQTAYLGALELARAAGDSLGVAAALGGAGISDPDRRPGDPEKIGRALAIFEEHGNHYGIASTLNGLAEIARASGDLGRAEQLYLRALQSAERAGAAHLEGIVTGNLAIAQMLAGRYAEAREGLRLGIERARRMGQRRLAGLLHVLALAAVADLGDWDAWDEHEREARHALDAIETSEEDVAWAAEHAARIAMRRGQSGRARAALELAAAHWRTLGRDDDAARCAPR